MFTKFHGIKLAKNGWIENLHVEQLTDDPVDTAPGRIWLNTTESILKYSVLEGDNIVTRKFPLSTITQAIVDNLLASISSLQTQMSGIPETIFDCGNF